ncbi:S8 family serine peptidase [Nocardioides sp. B-3]|uniref:S8 family serine peptidase n=1 Tax=Nocardioides sp. B-3 TaxID=2895565 RepID=UPI002152F2BE|nr:S8 family serine peptidase [Nocardioides sp. B-3]UUZ58293.1 S8 family serine peptidase [Nocardioides sp. B-3]
MGGDGSLSASQGGPDLAGVAPGVDFISMRVATPGFGIVDDLDWEEAALAAFDWTIRHREEFGIDITQNSRGLLPTEPNCLGLDCGEPTDFDAMSQMIGSVVDSGIHVVFSAGNDGPEPGTIGGYHDPANGAVLVGAACKSVDSSGCVPGREITGFSSRGAADGTGPQVDVVAPGDTIMAALSPSVLAPLTECAEIQQPGYFCISGTSMSSPHVSGVLALMLRANPERNTGPGEAVPALDSRRHDDPGLRHPLRARHGRHQGRAHLCPRADVEQEDALNGCGPRDHGRGRPIGPTVTE